jgi:hypothetical protein
MMASFGRWQLVTWFRKRGQWGLGFYRWRPADGPIYGQFYIKIGPIELRRLSWPEKNYPHTPPRG